MRNRGRKEAETRRRGVEGRRRGRPFAACHAVKLGQGLRPIISDCLLLISAWATVGWSSSVWFEIIARRRGARVKDC